MASDLGLHCLLMTFYGFPGKNGLMHKHWQVNVDFMSFLKE